MQVLRRRSPTASRNGFSLILPQSSLGIAPAGAGCRVGMSSDIMPSSPPSRCSSGVEQLIRNEQVVGSNPTSGSEGAVRVQAGMMARKRVAAGKGPCRWNVVKSFPFLKLGRERLPECHNWTGYMLSGTAAAYIRKNAIMVSKIIQPMKNPFLIASECETIVDGSVSAAGAFIGIFSHQEYGF